MEYSQKHSASTHVQMSRHESFAPSKDQWIIDGEDSGDDSFEDEPEVRKRRRLNTSEAAFQAGADSAMTEEELDKV